MHSGTWFFGLPTRAVMRRNDALLSIIYSCLRSSPNGGEGGTETKVSTPPDRH